MSEKLRRIRLGDRDAAESSSQIVAWTGSKKQLVQPAIVGRPATKLNPPKLVDVDRLAVGIPDRAHELSSQGIEAVDGSRFVDVVRHQQRVAQLSKIFRVWAHSPM